MGKRYNWRMSMIEYDRVMLSDRVRNTAFERALRDVVVPGATTVSDIGAGTGFLSFLAAKLGAKECIGYEFSPIISVAQALAKENDLRQCRFVAEHTSEVAKPVQTDVVVTETFGNLLVEEHLIENLRDAQRMVKPGGVIIPSAARQYVCPVVTPRHFEHVTGWRTVGHDLTFAAAERLSLNNMYVREIEPGDLWGEAVAYDAFTTHEELSSRRSGSARFTAGADRVIYGAAVWWEADLTADVTLSTAPAAPATHWKQIYLPVLEPIALRAGDALMVRITTDSRFSVGLMVTWSFIVERGDKVVAEQRLDIGQGRPEER